MIALSIDSRGVATLALNRPEKHNALDGETLRDLHAALLHIDGDAQVRVLVITGTGASFCAGADIAQLPAHAR
jgi:methylglutaconyl-CoA hydratase